MWRRFTFVACVVFVHVQLAVERALSGSTPALDIAGSPVGRVCCFRFSFLVHRLSFDQVQV